MLGTLILVVSTLLFGAYLLLDKFLKDRQSAINRPNFDANNQRVFNDNPSRTSPVSQQNLPPQGVVNQPATQAGEAAIQQQLRTLQEINRINEMNRRLLDQQQRMQNQR